MICSSAEFQFLLPLNSNLFWNKSSWIFFSNGQLHFHHNVPNNFVIYPVHSLLLLLILLLNNIETSRTFTLSITHLLFPYQFRATWQTHNRYQQEHVDRICKLESAVFCRNQTCYHLSFSIQNSSKVYIWGWSNKKLFTRK